MPELAPIPPDADSLWDIHDLAKFLKVSVETVRYWRKNGDGPPPVRRLGRHLRWNPDTVKAWLTADDTADAA